MRRVDELHSLVGKGPPHNPTGHGLLPEEAKPCGHIDSAFPNLKYCTICTLAKNQTATARLAYQIQKERDEQ